MDLSDDAVKLYINMFIGNLTGMDSEIYQAMLKDMVSLCFYGLFGKPGAD